MDQIVTRQATLNAKIAAAALVLGAVALHLLNQLELSLLPLRLLAIGLLIMGAWAFSDEMGLRKPLNRAALICFTFSMLALAKIVLEPDAGATQKYLLIYTFCLLFSVLIWSGAFLHRQSGLKIAGALGAVASVLPLLALIVGHISMGAGAYLGVSALLDTSNGPVSVSSTPVQAIEAMFIFWSIGTAIFLWRGHMSPLR